MASVSSGSLLTELRTLFDVGSLGGLTDGQLLDRFTDRCGERAEAAFKAIVERHGAMVLNVCRRVLGGDEHAALDAFQACFMVLARKAASIHEPDLLGNWLYGVAYRTAAKARAEGVRRRKRQGRRTGPPVFSPPCEVEANDLRAAIDQELSRLPERYRAPIVLCYLEGHTTEAAAHRLGCPKGTVLSRLSRGRDRLRSGLVRRGLAPSIAMLTATLTHESRAAMAASLTGLATRAAGSISLASAPVPLCRWVGRVLSTGSRLGLKRIAGGVLLVGIVGVGLGLMRIPAPIEGAQAVPAPDDPRPDRERFVGTWTNWSTTNEVSDGMPQPPKRVKTTWSITSDTITTTDGDGRIAFERRYVIDPTESLKSIDLTDPGTGLVSLGIYRFEGDNLTISMGAERPQTFDEAPAAVVLALKQESRTPSRPGSRLGAAPGCYWAVRPSDGVPSALNSSGFSLFVETDAERALLLNVARVAKDASDARTEFRPVVFDSVGKRYIPMSVMGGRSANPTAPEISVSLQRYRLDPFVLRAEKVTNLGIERVSEAARKAVATRAMERARTLGVTILPRAQIGEPFDFTLTTGEGKVVRAQDLKGKVVLLDCWATWCSPCMAKMPALRDYYAKHHADGFEVVGINFDLDQEKARRVVNGLKLSWAQVFVSIDESVRDLWREAAGIEGLPRLFVIDRDGILRFDGGPGESEKAIDPLLAVPAKKP